ncbi:hypothetical protein, partial [Escherichia coli]|uniref:hypothetical protein n=1 Tax=Escherichia coli TaxID=562 RepID=UPI001BC853AC
NHRLMSWIQQHFWKEYHTNLADEVNRMAYGGDVFNDITVLTARSLVFAYQWASSALATKGIPCSLTRVWLNISGICFLSQ